MNTLLISVQCGIPKSGLANQEYTLVTQKLHCLSNGVYKIIYITLNTLLHEKNCLGI